MDTLNRGKFVVVAVVAIAIIVLGASGYLFMYKQTTSPVQSQHAIGTTTQQSVEEKVTETSFNEKTEWVDTNVKPLSAPAAAPQNTSKEITMLTPNGGETLVRGKTYVITWTNPDHIGPVDIFLVKGGQMQTDAGFAPGAGTTAPTSFTWTVDPITLDLKTRKTHSLPDGDDYKIRVSNQHGDVFDESDAVFSIISE